MMVTLYSRSGSIQLRFYISTPLSYGEIFTFVMTINVQQFASSIFCLWILFCESMVERKSMVKELFFSLSLRQARNVCQRVSRPLAVFHFLDSFRSSREGDATYIQNISWSKKIRKEHFFIDFFRDFCWYNIIL